MGLELVDTHCHLDLEPLASSVGEVLQRAQAAGVELCVSIGTSVAASRANVALARRHPSVVAAVGVHPNDTDGISEGDLAEIERLSTDPRVVAIGEVGLDYYRTDAAPENQDKALRGFLAIARRRNLPLLIHCRNAYEALIRLLKEHRHSSLRGVMHCASGPPEFIREALALGFHISFAGNVTFPNAQALRQLVPLVPDERLLIETDAPFLAPQPVRGRKNEPAFVAHTADFLARLRGISAEALGAMTSRNARLLLNPPSPAAVPTGG